MAPKAKAAEPAKKDDVEMKPAEEAKPEKPAAPEEPEKDAPADKRPKIGAPVVMNDYDTTLDTFVSAEGTVLSSLTADGFQYLMSGARSNTGITGGRYMFEVKIIESHNPHEVPGRGRAPLPKQIARIGFSKADSSLIMGDSPDNACFDTEGAYLHNGSRQILQRQRFGKHETIAVVLNLDTKTMSVFRNGNRAGDPIPLPESLQGCTLFPTVTFKNMTLAMNFGPSPWKALPFQCRFLSDAAKADTSQSTVKRPANGKYKVVYPVGFPSEGFFDYCDQFLKSNPDFTELSDRKILEWCDLSGLRRTAARGDNSLDRPQFNFGLAAVDDLSIRKILRIVAATAKRNFLIGELKGNLVRDERAESLKLFSGSSFEKSVHVIMGEPPKDFKDYQQSIMKEDKKKIAEEKRRQDEVKQNADRVQKLNQFKRKKAEEKRKAQLEKQRKKIDKEKAKKAKAAEMAKKKAEKLKAKEAKKKAREEAKKKRAEEGKEGEEEEKEEESEPEAEEEEKDADMDEEDPSKEEEEKEDPEMAALEKPIEVPLAEADLELTEEEKAQIFRPQSVPDLTVQELAFSFAKFKLPDKSEGFNEIKYVWSKGPDCEKKLKSWVLEKKLTERIEDLVPSDWYHERLTKMSTEREEYKKKQKEYQAKKAAEPKEEKAPEEKKEGEEGEKKEGEEAEKEAPKPPEPKTQECENVDDVGEGVPLYKDFESDDWVLLNLRAELHLLIHAFKHDVDDDDRPGVTEQHLAFYYQKYFKRAFSLHNFGVKTFEDLLDLIKGALRIVEQTKVIEAELDVDAGLDAHIKLTEESRRERRRRIDAGDESARLNFSTAATAAAAAKAPQGVKRPYGGATQGAAAQRARGGSGYRPAWRPYSG